MQTLPFCSHRQGGTLKLLLLDGRSVNKIDKVWYIGVRNHQTRQLLSLCAVLVWVWGDWRYFYIVDSAISCKTYLSTNYSLGFSVEKMKKETAVFCPVQNAKVRGPNT